MPWTRSRKKKPITLASDFEVSHGISSKSKFSLPGSQARPKGKHQSDVPFDKYIKTNRIVKDNEQLNNILGDAGRKVLDLIEDSKLSGNFSSANWSEVVRGSAANGAPITDVMRDNRSRLNTAMQCLEKDEREIFSLIVVRNFSFEKSGVQMGYSIRKAPTEAALRLRNALTKLACHFGILSI